MLILIGFVYHSVTIGVPYPDPTLEQAVNQQKHTTMSQRLIQVGSLIFVLGLIRTVTAVTRERLKHKKTFP